MDDKEKILKKRFGKRYYYCPKSSDLISQLSKRSTCRSFDPRPLEENLLEYLLSVSQSTSTSGGLQTYSVISLETQEEKNKLLNNATAINTIGGKEEWNLRALRDCSVFLIWIADLHRTEFVLEHLLETNQIDREIYLQVTRAEYHLKSIIDTALLAQSFSLCAESLGLGIMYCGAIRLISSKFFQENFGLPQHTFPIFGMAVGYPGTNKYTPIKPRLSTDMILHRGHYNKIKSVTEFEDYNRRHLQLLRTSENNERDFFERIAERLETSPSKLSVGPSLKNMGFDFK